MSHSPETAQSHRTVELYRAGWKAILRMVRSGKSWSGYERNCVFLNCGTSLRFANVSAATGLDFADDGRALATVDWDHDGDLDLWLHNRTGPRLRLMLNQIDVAGGADRFVALRLRGTTCNRDAIGARVEVVLGVQGSGIRRQESRKLVQTLYAGDAFHSQSSKWLHFGLGAEPQIKHVVVHWPGDQTERFTGVLPGRQYLLVQGKGAAIAWTRPGRPAGGLKLAPSTQKVAKSDPAPVVLLPVPVPMPVLSYATFDSSEPRDIETSEAPLLVNFWATWCAPCVVELKAMTEHEQRLRNAGLDVLTLSVDGLGLGKSTTPADARSFLQRINYPFASGLATAKMLDKLQILNEFLFDRHEQFVVPLSLLLDRYGRLTAIYRGRVRVDLLLEHMVNLNIEPGKLQALSMPLGGSSYRPVQPDLLELAERFGEHEPYLDEGLRYTKLELARQAKSSQAKFASERDRKVFLARQADTHHGLGMGLIQQGRLAEAIEHYRQAIEIEPEYVEAYNSLGHTLLGIGKAEEAIKYFRQALQIAPQHIAARSNLGAALAARGKLSEAVTHYREALKLNPDLVEAHTNLGKALTRLRQFDEAIRHFQHVLHITPDNSEAHTNLGAALGSQGNHSEAVAHFRAALKLSPNAARAHNNLAQALLGQDKTEEAIKSFRTAVRLAPDYAAAHFGLGMLLKRLGNEEEAIKHLRRAEELRGG